MAEYRIAFFVSPNAVEHAMSVFGGVAWPAHLQVAGVGPGTAKALAAHGFDRCIVPSTRFDTESVLALPEFSHAAIAGAGVLVLRGQHGREVLADTLRLRGAQVDTLSCYTRSAAELDARTLLEKPLHGLVITSSEGLHYLHECPGGARLLHTKTIFVSHARIAETAENLGSAQIVLTEPGDAGIVAGIQHHFRTQESSS